MDCQETRNVIPDYVEHTVSEEVTNAVEEHLCVCPSCRDFLSQCIDKAASKDFSASEVKTKPQSQPKLQPKSEVNPQAQAQSQPKPQIQPQVQAKPQPEPAAVEPAAAVKLIEPVSPAVAQPKVAASSDGKFGPFEIGIILVGLGILGFLASLLLKK
jgi:uncharacterized membrane protein